MVMTGDLALAPSDMGSDRVPNQIHFTTASQLVLGERMGNALLALAGSGGGALIGSTSGGSATRSVSGGGGGSGSASTSATRHDCVAGSALARAVVVALSALLRGRRASRNG